MKKALVITLVLAGSVALAKHHEEKKGENFAQRKAKILEKIDKRISAMGEHKKCVSAAKDQKALKACRGKMKEMKSEWKEHMKGGKHHHKGMKGGKHHKGMMDDE
jgi:hypothetical protein